eukprot:1328712-Amorphochlora_amoeboformis.AAC.1
MYGYPRKINIHTCNPLKQILDEIRPYLVGASGGSLEYLGGIESNQIKIRITGPASKILTVRVAVKPSLLSLILLYSPLPLSVFHLSPRDYPSLPLLHLYKILEASI